jgi:ribonucleotide reductase beta subunit family protein with ferritin-like domain
MSKIFNTTQIDYTNEPMFFGSTLNSQRFDRFKYPKFEQLNEQMLSFFWRPQEVSLQKDRNDYMQLTEGQKHIFTSNLKYQTLLDSVQGRAPAIAFLPIVSIPELEGAINTWNFFEGSIHSKSYSYIMQNLYPNPTEIFDSIITDQAILERAKKVTVYYDNLIEKLNQRNSSNPPSLYELKKHLYLALINVNILEGLRFYASFACTFAFGENKLMEGSAKILSLIARDENVHFALTTNIINYMIERENDKDYQQIREETHDQVIQMYLDILEQEKAWANYLFNQGTIIGLNERLLCDYLEYLAVRRAKNIGYTLPINAQTTNPLPWMDNWLTSKNLQVAPQESEIENYLIAAVVNDITDETFKDFVL